jgi:Ca-activated chloride channel family protein
MRSKGVGISTMGLGLDYNEDLMQAIAERAGGNYYYIENPAQMSRIFQQEMATLFATVAQKVKMSFDGTQAVERVEVFGFPSEVSGARADIAMEDFYAGEQRSLLLRLEIGPQPKGAVPLGSLTLDYVDQVDNQARSLTMDLQVMATADVQRVEASRNDPVIVEATLIEADKKHEQYIRLYEQGNIEEAQEKIDALAGALASKNTDLNDIQLAKKVEALRMETEQMAEAESSQGARSSYLKQSKQRAYKAVRGRPISNRAPIYCSKAKRAMRLSACRKRCRL